MKERTNKLCFRTHAAAWLAVSQPFGLADNAPSLSRATGMPQPHGLDSAAGRMRDNIECSRKQ